MSIHWDRDVSERDMMKKLIKYRKLGYNHVTFLWWEPFIHDVLHFATKFAQRLWYVTLVTTNASTLQFDIQAKKHLPSIDQIILSIPIIDKKVQPIINDTKGIIDFDNVFKNISQYWDWDFIKVNTVINLLNMDHILGIIDFIWKRGVKEMSITYPDINIPYYTKQHIMEKVAPKYWEVKQYIEKWILQAEVYGINLKIVDMPLCCLPSKEYIKYTDDYCYQTRTKVNGREEEVSRDEYLPRRRWHVYNCKSCEVKDVCWWVSQSYDDMYGLMEIAPLSNIDVNIRRNDFLQKQKGTG